MSLPKPSGVYELTLGEHISADFELDFSALVVVEKVSMLQTLSNTFHFPDYFGLNWDAAFDCLLEVLDEHEKLDILVKLPVSANIDEDVLAMLRQLMLDAIAMQPVNKQIRVFMINHG